VFVCLSVHASIHPPIHLPGEAWVFFCLSVCPSINVPVRLDISAMRRISDISWSTVPVDRRQTDAGIENWALWSHATRGSGRRPAAQGRVLRIGTDSLLWRSIALLVLTANMFRHETMHTSVSGIVLLSGK
jgi:hypothetical protein